MGNVPLICATLAVAFLVGGPSEVEVLWREHCERAEEHLKHREEYVTDEEIRRADAEYATAAGIARDAGRDDLLIEALKGRIDCLESLVDFPGLLEVSREILAIQRSIDDRLGAARTCQDLGYLEAEMGDLATAIRYLQESEEWFLAANDPAEVAQARIRLANACTIAGQPWFALGAAEAAYREFEKRGDRLSLAEACRVLSSIFGALGDSVRSLEHAREALKHDPEGKTAPVASYHLAIGEALFWAGYQDRDFRMVEGRNLIRAAAKEFAELGDPVSAGFALTSLANTSQALGDARGALDEVEKLAAICRGHPRLKSWALTLRGRAHASLGEFERAAGYYKTGMALARELCYRRVEIDCHAGLARVCYRTGDTEGALSHVLTAMRSLDRRPPGASPLANMDHRRRSRALFRTAVGVAFSLKDVARTFELIERTRAATLVDGLGSREVFVDRDFPQEFHDRVDAARAELALARTALREAIATGETPARKMAGRRVRRAEDAYHLTLDPLLRGAGSRGTPPRSLAETQGLLEDDQALVLYAFTEERLRALVVTSKGAFLRDLGARKTIEVDARLLRERLSSSDAPAPESTLANDLIGKLELPEGVERLLISPDGVLAHLPFALLAPAREVVFVPSATSYALLVESSGEPGDDILAMGDPAYPQNRPEWTTDVRRGGPNLFNLPATGEEVRENTGPGDIRLLGVDATERKLRKSLSRRARWRSVHLACHGLLNLRRPAWSALALAPDEREDGYLTVLDVFTMRVPTDLVVLSACDSGVGRATEGEGSLGLPIAFMHAGSSRVLASLWIVHDDPTRILMKEFYRVWKKPGVSAVRALRKAQEAVKKAGYDHPRHWAAWMLWGVPD